MTNNDIRAIALELNRRAPGFEIGRLQDIREHLKGRRARTNYAIFDPRTIFDENGYAFHYGGRPELQFNIGIESVSGIEEVRFGVAFSFETSQTYPTIETLVEVLAPKVQRFNDYLRLYFEDLAGLRMWHFSNDQRSSDYNPTAIGHELMVDETFVFLGKRQPVSRLDYDVMLSWFDKLLPLYKYVETPGAPQPTSTVTSEAFTFRPSKPAGMSSTIASTAQRTLDVSLRHNLLQVVLYKRLAAEYGSECVGHELPSGVGTRIDLVVKRQDEYWFYEIKVSGSPRACLRQAIGQLLEYGYWPGARQPARLIVVGEMPLDEEGRQYLATLKQHFGLDIEYQQITI